jgi:formimidoylglutamate deiminase
MPILVPDLVYLNDSFRSGLAVEYDDQAGRITRVLDHAELGTGGGAGPVVELRERALLPGFVNAHSHSFQRLIRGRTQWRTVDTGAVARSDFWTWREAMYDAALRLTPDDVYDAARFCFIEMLRAGITAVGEFHYLHNDEQGRQYADRNELAQRVIAAARDAGLRIRLLNVCYATGGIGAPLGTEQRRFATSDLDAFLAACASLGDDLADDALASVGVAPHSVRAVPRDWLPALHAWAVKHDVPLHMHVSEQPAEVRACVDAYGARPVELLHGDGVLDDRFTAVHATHIDDDEVRMLASSGSTVCACPTTERDLGDGMLRAADLLDAGGSIALGDSSWFILFALILWSFSFMAFPAPCRASSPRCTSTHGARRHAALLRLAARARAVALRRRAGQGHPGGRASRSSCSAAWRTRGWRRRRRATSSRSRRRPAHEHRWSLALLALMGWYGSHELG